MRGATAEGAVVVTVTVIFVVELPGVTGFGVPTEHADSDGAPVQTRVTAWLNPPCPPATLILYVPDFPGARVSVVEVPEATANVKSWPVPVRATV